MEIDCIRLGSEEERRESVKAVIDVAFSLCLGLALSLVRIRHASRFII